MYGQDNVGSTQIMSKSRNKPFSPTTQSTPTSPPTPPTPQMSPISINSNSPLPLADNRVADNRVADDPVADDPVADDPVADDRRRKRRLSTTDVPPSILNVDLICYEELVPPNKQAREVKDNSKNNINNNGDGDGDGEVDDDDNDDDDDDGKTIEDDAEDYRDRPSDENAHPTTSTVDDVANTVTPPLLTCERQ